MSFSKKLGKNLKRIRNSLEDDACIWETKQNEAECEKIKKESKGIPTLEEMEHRALAERIMNIMKITYERLLVALFIPHILAEEKSAVSQLISKEQRKELFRMCENYLDNYVSSFDKSGYA